MEKQKFYLVAADALPEVFLRVAEAKRMLQVGEAATVGDAARQVGISRSAFYKYKDAVQPFQNMHAGHIITFYALLKDNPGVLSNYLSIFANSGANILTINQTIPTNGCAGVTISAETGDMSEELDDLMTRAAAAEGVRRFTVGFAKKILLANQFGALASAYKSTQDASVLFVWLYALAFLLQVYFDFSGYSDMAIGLGRMLGFHFPENFDYPYTAASVTEFWRRWHISLSTWFREYVYIPLGGNRKGKGRQLLNIAIVWLLTGLWHGANWNFVLWGVYYAVLLLLEKTFLLKWLDKAPRFVGHVYTCFCFVMGWVLFAITDLGALGAYVGHMFSGTFADSTTAYLLRCGWLLLVLCAWGILPDREVPGILWVGLGLLTAELAILWGKTWWESRGRGQAIPAGAHWWQAEKEELAAAAVMLAVWWGFLALCAAGVLPHMEPDRYSWLLAGAVTILIGAELLLWPRGRRDR